MYYFYSMDRNDLCNAYSNSTPRRHDCRSEVFIPLPSLLAFSLAAFSRLLNSASIPIPPKTNPTPTHCMLVKLCPNHSTEMIMVSIFRVTVTVTRSREPKIERVRTGMSISSYA